MPRGVKEHVQPQFKIEKVIVYRHNLFMMVMDDDDLRVRLTFQCPMNDPDDHMDALYSDYWVKARAFGTALRNLEDALDAKDARAGRGTHESRLRKAIWDRVYEKQASAIAARGAKGE
jgi:hypothetical protein